MKQEGQLIRTRGGAVLGVQSITLELPYEVKRHRHLERKRRIAAAAGAMVHDGQTPILDAGSTTYQLAFFLLHRRNLTLGTNHLQVTLKLASNPNIALVCTGGIAGANVHALLGPRAEAFLRTLRVSRAFLGADAIHPDGKIAHVNLEEVATKQAMVRAGEQVIVVADSSKFGVTGLAEVCRVKEVEAVVSDGGVPGEMLQRMHGALVEATVVQAAKRICSSGVYGFGDMCSLTQQVGPMNLTLQDLTRLYRIMLLSRAFEEAIVELFCAGHTRCYTPHLGMGEEAVSAGAFYGLREDDIISPHYRGSTCAWFVRGLPPGELLATYLGKRSSGLSSEMVSQWGTNLKLNVMTNASGILGGPMDLAVGAALAFKLKGTRQVVVNAFGDGTSNRSNFHEALNFAAVFKLPIVFVCENNQWAMNTPVTWSVPVRRISERAAAYGFNGISVDGNDVIAVHTAVQDAVRKAREGQGPTLVEALTYRMARHSERDDDWYRSKAELEEWRAKDPIIRLRLHLLGMGVDKSDLTQIKHEVRQEIDTAVQEAQAMLSLTAEEQLARMHSVYKDIYGEMHPATGAMYGH